MKFIDQSPQEIHDPDLLALFSEIKAVTKVDAHEYSTVWSFLTQSLYRWGSEKRYKLEKNELNPTGQLIRNLGRLQGTALFQLCDEIAAKRAESAELYINTALYSFLNKLLPDFSKKKKPYKFHPRDIDRLFE